MVDAPSPQLYPNSADAAPALVQQGRAGQGHGQEAMAAMLMGASAEQSRTAAAVPRCMRWPCCRCCCLWGPLPLTPSLPCAPLPVHQAGAPDDHPCTTAGAGGLSSTDGGAMYGQQVLPHEAHGDMSFVMGAAQLLPGVLSPGGMPGFGAAAGLGGVSPAAAAAAAAAAAGMGHGSYPHQGHFQGGPYSGGAGM